MIYAPPQIPNYLQGLARHPGESECPELWNGLVGLWAPFLGPTGGELVDWSGRGNHGELSNMASGSWVVRHGNYVLDYDGSDDYVNTGVSRVGGTGLFCAASERFTALMVGRRDMGGSGTYIARADVTQSQRTFQIYDSGTAVYTVLRGANYNCWPSDNAWHQYAVSWDGTSATAYRDALDVVSPSVGTAAEETTQRIVFGARSNGAGYRLNGQIGLVAIWDRTLGPTEIRGLCHDRYRLLRPRRRILTVLPTVGGPYRVLARQTFHTGAAAAETFSTGTIIGECHGRSG